MATQRIVCLANSYKNGGRCVAGIVLFDSGFGHWIRPVSNRPGRSLNLAEYTCADGTSISILDIFDIEFEKAIPEGYQSENVLIAPGSRWVKSGQLPVAALEPMLHNGNSPIWPRTESSYHGCNDKITVENLNHVKNSLALVKPRNATIRVFQNDFREPGKFDVRVDFWWGGQRNNLKLTDPQMLDLYQEAGIGMYNLENPTMCISIGEVLADTGSAYKLVASLIT